MKKLYTLLFALLGSVVMFGQKEERKLDNFTGLQVSGGISVEIYEGSPHADINVTKGDIDDLITEVRDGVLKIKFENKWFNSGSRQAKIKLYSNLNLEEISGSAGAYIHSEETLTSGDLEVDCSSGASVDLVVETGDCEADVSSGGSLKLSGEASDLEASSSSGGSFNGSNLKSADVEVSASSGGVAKVWVTGDLEASASSGGSVKYKGDPKSTDINVGKYSGGNVSRM